jgi:hypothetical protein
MRALRAQTRNVDFVETGFTSRTDFIVIRYSVTNNVLPSNSRFLFHVEVVEVRRVGENIVALKPLLDSDRKTNNEITVS